MDKKRLVLLIDILIFILLVCMGIYLYINDYHKSFPAICGLLAAVMAGFIGIRFLKKIQPPGIRKIALVNEQEEIIKEWHISRQQGLLIGKSVRGITADIDLADTEYAVLIAEEHALLNCVDGKWYVEDMGSRNGTGIKHVQENKVRRMESGELEEVRPGDRIYIAKSILTLNR